GFLSESTLCVRTLVTADGAGEESICRGSDTGKSGEFQLQINASVLRTRTGADKLATDDPHAPAAGAVLEAGEPLDRLVVEERIAVPAEGVPLLVDRPGRRQLVLVQEVALEAVTEVDDLLARRLELDVGLGALAARLVGVPLHAEIRVPVLVRREGK